MTQHQEMQAIIRHYRETTGKTEWKMDDVVQWAVEHGWPLPAPITPLERLAREFSKAAREETRKDGKTGKPYRVNHAFKPDGQQITFWIDIDQAPRKHMAKSAIQRREQVVGDVLQLTLDLDHWNRVNPAEEPITVPLDFTEDVEWRKNAPGEDEKTG